MRRFVMMAVAAGLVSGSALTLGGTEAQAQRSFVRDYGYQFCALKPPNRGHYDCNYWTWQQCQMTASPDGTCVENPAYIAARANAAVPYEPRRARRHAQY